MEYDVITFSPLFLIGPLSCLQVTMTHIRAWMSSKFDQIETQTTELAALERLKLMLFMFAIDPINFKFLVDEDMHDI